MTLYFVFKLLAHHKMPKKTLLMGYEAVYLRTYPSQNRLFVAGHQSFVTKFFTLTDFILPNIHR